MFLALLLAVASPPQTQTWTVDGIQRVAYVQAPSIKAPSNAVRPIVGSRSRTSEDAEDSSDAQAGGPPLVFVFHGHGGTGRNMARKDFATQWPEAYFVFPDGLNTKSYYDPEGKRSGWQNSIEDYDNRDLKFFDAMLATMLKLGVDPNRVYATGHSNGGFFSYLLWAERRDKLAAIASSAGGGPDSAKLQPLPAMHLAGRGDSIVRFSAQEQTIDLVKRVNRCENSSTTIENVGEEFASTLATPVVTFIHNGGHEFLDDAPQRIVSFLKMHTRPVDGYPNVDPVQPAGTNDRFTQFDTNGDDKIDADELQRPFLFRVLDKNSDGVITRTEAASALGKL